MYTAVFVSKTVRWFLCMWVILSMVAGTLALGGAHVLCSVGIIQGYSHGNKLSVKSVFCWGRIDSRRR